MYYFIYYLVLVFILLLGAVGFQAYRGFPDQQMVVLILTGCFYVVWGFVYHYLRKNLHLKVVIEYILIALIAIVLINSVINGG